MKSIVWAGALVGLALCSGQADSAPVKRKAPVTKPKPATKPKSGEQLMVEAYALNVLSDPAQAPSFCKPVKFAYLAEMLVEHGGTLSGPRGEFETTADFEARVQAVSSVFSSIGDMSTCLELSEISHYDADSERFGVTVNNKQLVYSDEKSLPSAVGKTVSGVTFRYDRGIERNYYIRLAMEGREFNDSCAKAFRWGLNFSVPSPAHLAPRLKAGGHLVIQGRLDYPYALATEDAHDATLIERWQSLTNNIELPITPKRLMVIDGAGAVVWQCEVQGGHG